MSQPWPKLPTVVLMTEDAEKRQKVEQVGIALIEVFTLPGLIHMESMWNPWNPSAIPCGIHGMNVGWDHSQPKKQPQVAGCRL